MSVGGRSGPSAAAGGTRPATATQQRSAGVEEPSAPPTRRSYAQAASSPLDGADWVYVRRGDAAKPLADQYSNPNSRCWEVATRKF